MYNYLYDGQQHTDTSPDYLKKLGMDDDGIEALQRDAKDYEDHQWFDFINERDEFLNESDWMILRQINQQQLTIETSMTEEAYLELLTWRQQLSDMPETMSSGYSKGITWPPLPPFLEDEFPDYPG